MMAINTMKLENNQEYLIIDTIVMNKNEYLILVNENDKYDICVRKIGLQNDQECLIKLDNEEEFAEVITLFNNKHVGKEREENEK